MSESIDHEVDRDGRAVCDAGVENFLSRVEAVIQSTATNQTDWQHSLESMLTLMSLFPEDVEVDEGQLDVQTQRKIARSAGQLNALFRQIEFQSELRSCALKFLQVTDETVRYSPTTTDSRI